MRNAFKTPIKTLAGARRMGVICGLALAMAGGGAAAQDEVLDGAQDWHPFSRSAVRLYMAEMKGMVTEGDVHRVTLAVVPLQGEAGDYSHSEEIVEFRCAAKESRSVAAMDFGADGVQTDRYDDASSWEAYNPNGRDGFLAGLVCDGNRANPPTWPSIKAWVDAGRK
ncbi:hypothetical protein ACO2Q1_08720 [Brevundimonas sp. VNH65]|uniref:hypothetical protein n=1 Tax=Brevundimonas sp. VNH65 TaxID=3400917 RepID=UPI003C0A25EC